LDSNPKLPEDLFVVSEGNRHILLHPKKPVWTVVNDSGLMVAKKLDGTKNIAKIAKEISQEFSLDEKSILEDIKNFVNQLEISQLFDQPRLGKDDNGKFSKMDLYVTENCNLRCRHCAVSDGTYKEDLLSLAKISELIDEYHDLGGTAVNLIGGEPLLREDIKEIIDYASRKMNVIIPTNGLLLDDNLCRFLSRYDNISIQISIDGATSQVHDYIRGKGTFKKIMKGIEFLKRYNLLEKTSFSYVIMKPNLEEVKKIIELGEDLNIPEVRFTLIHKAGKASKDWKKLNSETDEYIKIYTFLYEELFKESKKTKIIPGLEGFYLYFEEAKQEEMWCNVGRTFCIDHAGDVFPCSLFKLEGLQMGNVFRSTLQDIAKSKKFIDFREKCKNRKDLIEECKVCPFKNFCQGGCPARSYVLYNDMNKVDFMCGFRKELFKKMILEFSSLKLKKLKLDEWV